MQKNKSNSMTSRMLSKKELVRLLKLPQKEISEYIYHLLLNGCIERYNSYFKMTPKLLLEIGIVNRSLTAKDFNRLAISPRFLLKDIQQIMDCNRDEAKIFADKYMLNDRGWLKKSDRMTEMLEDGITEFSLEE